MNVEFEINVYTNKIKRVKLFTNFMKDLLGAVTLIIIIPFVYLLSKTFPDKRGKIIIKKIIDDELSWNLIINYNLIKVYEGFVSDWPEELDFLDFHQGDEYVKKLKSEPEIKELDNLFFGDFYPYDLEHNYLVYNDGMFLIAYPQSKDEPDNFKLIYLDFETKWIYVIKDNVLSVNKAETLQNGSIKIHTNDGEKQEIIRIKKIITN